MAPRAGLRSWALTLAPRLPVRLLGMPPALFDLPDYKRWFPTTGRVFRRYLARLGAMPQRLTGDPAVVVIAPWVSTPTPWYGVMLAIGLARRGRRVVLLWDDTGFTEDDVDEQNRIIGVVLAVAGRLFEIVRLSSQSPAAPTDADDELIDRMAALNLVWRLRGGVQTAADQELRRQLCDALAASLPRIRTALSHLCPAYLVVPGGVYGSSGLFLAEAGDRGWRVATFDSDQGVGQLCVDGVAAQNGDIARAFELIWGAGDDARAQVVVAAKAEFGLRMQSRDGYGFQTAPAAGPRDESVAAATDTVLLPMNVEWDTAALGKHTNFADTVDWLLTTIPVILELCTHQVIVRQHPSERRALQRSHLDIGSILSERFAGEARVRLVAAEDVVNTYDLLRESALVLPFVSTIAIEAAAMGKQVLISGDGYYRHLGFVYSATSRGEYLDLLVKGLAGRLEQLPDQVERAWACFYLTAVRNRIPTNFTPHPADFWGWSQRPPQALFDDPEVSDMISAIEGNQPVAYLRHLRLTGRSA